MFKRNLSNVLILTLGVALFGCASNEYDQMHGEKFKEGEAKPISFWWPERLDLQPLSQHAKESNPYGENFDYAKEFKKLDLSRS